MGSETREWTAVKWRLGAADALGWVLARDGEWEWEPQPSSRDDDFMARTRFASFTEAADFFACHGVPASSRSAPK